MKSETWIYSEKKHNWKKATKLDLFWRKIKYNFTKFKIIDTSKYKIIPWSDSKYYFKMTPKEYEDADKIYKEKGTISYEFYPCAGISFGLKVHVSKTDEVIDISDVESW